MTRDTVSEDENEKRISAAIEEYVAEKTPFKQLQLKHRFKHSKATFHRRIKGKSQSIAEINGQRQKLTKLEESILRNRLLFSAKFDLSFGIDTILTLADKMLLQKHERGQTPLPEKFENGHYFSKSWIDRFLSRNQQLQLIINHSVRKSVEDITTFCNLEDLYVRASLAANEIQLLRQKQVFTDADNARIAHLKEYIKDILLQERERTKAEDPTYDYLDELTYEFDFDMRDSEEQFTFKRTLNQMRMKRLNSGIGMPDYSTRAHAHASAYASAYAQAYVDAYKDSDGGRKLGNFELEISSLRNKADNIQPNETSSGITSLGPVPTS